MILPSNSSTYIIDFFDEDMARRVFAVPKEYILNKEGVFDSEDKRFLWDIVNNIFSDIPSWAFKVSSLETLNDVEAYLKNIGDYIPFSMYNIESGGFSFPRTVEDFLEYTGLKNHYLKPLAEDDPRVEFENLTGEIEGLPHRLETIRDFYSGFTKKISGVYHITKLPLIITLDEREFIPGFIEINDQLKI